MEPVAGNSGRAQKTAAESGSLEAPEQPVVTVSDPTRADAYTRAREVGSEISAPVQAPVSLEAPEPDAEELHTEPETAAAGTVVSDDQSEERPHLFSLFRFNRTALLVTGGILLLLVLLIGAAVALYGNTKNNNLSSGDVGNYSTGKLSLGNLQPNNDLQLGTVSQLAINGLLTVNNSLVLVPTTTPTSPVAGQFYYNKADNTAYFYNGTQFVSLSPAHVSSIAGQSGAITLDTSLQLTGNGLGLSSALLQQIASAVANGGPRVTSLQGLTGAVTLNGGAGITINGNTISNSGLVSLTSGSGNLAITNDGSGHYTITDTGGGGAVTSLTGTPNQINVSASTGNVTLSLPQDIAVSSTPTFGGLTVTGSLAVQGANSLSLGSASGNTGSIKLFNGSNGNTLTLQSGATASNLTFMLPVSDGANGSCLQTNGSGVLSFQTCTGGPGGGVTSINGQNGIVNINNASGTGGAITIDNAKADAATKGIAAFNATNFTDNGSGVINTVQDISSTSSPTFGGVTVNGTTTTTTLNATSSIQLNGVNINTAGTLSNVAYLNGTGPQTFTGNNKFTGTLAAQTTSPTAFQVQDGTGTSNLFVANTSTNRVGIGTLGPGYKLDVQGGDINTSGIYRVNGAQISSADLSNDANLAKLNAANVFAAANTFSSTVTIQGSNSLTLGSTGNAGSIIFRDGSTANTGTLQLGGALSGNVTFSLPNVTGAQTVCTVESGNCAGSGSGITGSGTINRLAKFTAGQAIGDSNISDDGTTVTVSSGQVIQGAAGLTIGNTGVNGQLVFRNSSNGNTLMLQSGATTGNLTLTLPTGDGANGSCLKTNGSGVLSFASCTGGAGGGVTSINTLTGVLNLVGTANQIDVSSAGDTIQLSLPQNISTGSNATFRTVTLNAQDPGDTLITGNAMSGATGKLVDLKTGGISQFTVDPSGNVNATGQYQINGVQISSANLSDGNNLAKLNGTGPQTFTGNNKFTGTVLAQLDSSNAFQIQNSTGTSNLFNADTNTSRIGIGTLTPGYTLDVNGDINTSGVYRINGVAICTAGGCTPSSGSGDYIQNGTAPQTANFNVTGTGVIGTSLTTPLVTSTGALAVTGGTTLSLQSTGANAVSLDSGTTGAVNIGTGANAKTITVGNATANSQINLIAGAGQGAAGDINIGANAITSGNREINIGSTASTAGSNTVLIATSNNASYSQSVTIGSAATGNSTTTLQSGSTGAVNVNSVGASTLASTTHIADTTNATGAQVVTIGSKAANNGNNTTIQGGSGSGAVSIQTAASGTISVGTSGVANTIQIGNTSGAVAQTINIGTNGTASSTNNVTIGSTAGGTTTLQNSAGIALNAPAITTNAATVALLNTTATTINFGGAASTLNIGPGGAAATSVNLAGGSGATGCTVDGATGNLTCSGAITTTATTGQQGWWTRTGTTLQPATAGDSITTTGNISATGTGAVSAAGGLTAGVSGTSGQLILDRGDGTKSFTLSNLGDEIRSYANGGNSFYTWYTTTGSLQLSMTLTSTGQLQLATQGSTGGLQIGGDATLYRSATNQLTTNSDLVVQGGDLLTNQTTASLFNTTATTLNVGGAATTLNIGPGGATATSINLAGGSGATGCTVDGATGNLTCSGNITGATTGTVGYWTRTGTTLQPANAGDSVQLDNNTSILFKDSLGTARTVLGVTAANNVQLMNGASSGSLQLENKNNTGGILFYTGTGVNQVASLNATGQALFQNSTDSTTAFQIQSSSATSSKPLFTADTSNMRVQVGSAGTPTSQLFVSGSAPAAATGSVTPSTSGLQDIRVRGNYAYTIDYSNSLFKVVDISNPASMSVVGSVSTNARPQALAVAGNYAYVADDTGQSLDVINISNPASPAMVGNIGLGHGAFSIAVSGRYAYVGVGSGLIRVIDITNPSNPTLASTFSATGNPASIAVAGNYLYYADTAASGTFYTVNISNPANLSAVGSISLGGQSACSAGGILADQNVFVAGKYAYVTVCSTNTVKIFNISNPASPTAVGSGISTGASSGPMGINVQGRYAYVNLYNGNQFAIFDVANPASPGLIGATSTGASSGPLTLAIQGRYAYVADWVDNKINSYDLGGSYIQQLEAGGISTSGLSVNGNSSFAGDINTAGGLQVGQSVDISGNLGVGGQVLFRNATNSSTAFAVQNSAGTSALNVDTSSMITTVTAGTDGATLGSELFTGSTSFPATTGWTAISGTGQSATATHASGTTALSPTPALAVGSGNYYMVSWTITNPNNGGTLAITMGGKTLATYTFTPDNSGTYSFDDSISMQLSSTANLAFTPNAAFTGKVSNVSVKQVTLNFSPGLVVKSASGINSLEVRTSTDQGNMFVGYEAGLGNVNGGGNTALGSWALQSNVTGDGNTAVGTGAMESNVTGDFNVALGNNALKANTSGGSNVALGSSALVSNIQGSVNVAIGDSALAGNIDGGDNIAIGHNALQSNISSWENVAIGSGSLSSFTGGGSNTAVGYASLRDVVTGYNNTAFGTFTLEHTTGSENAAFGTVALQNTTTGGQNTAMGTYSLAGNTTGSNNVALGYSTLTTNTTGQFNTAIGDEADVIYSGLQGATAIGSGAAVGSNNTIILGYNSAFGVNNHVGIGTSYAQNPFEVAPNTYSTGTITQAAGSGSVVGTGTTFTATMVGATIFYPDGTTGIITAYTDATHVTSNNTTGGWSASKYAIVWGGFNVNSDASVWLQNTTDSSEAFSVVNKAGNQLLTVNTATPNVNVSGTGSNGGGGRLSFGDYNPTTANTVWIGEQGSGDTDVLQLNGEQGIVLTAGSYTSPVTVATFTSGGQLQLTTQGSSGGITIGGDTQLFRFTANMLGMGNGDSFRTFSSTGSQFMTLQSAATSVYLDARNNAATDWILDSATTADTQNRYILKTDGTMQWGGGSATQDTQLSRTGTGSLAVQSLTNSTTAFQILQGTTNASLFTADTTNMNITMQGGYSGETNTWAATSSLPSPGREGNGVLIANGYIYSFAGSVSGGGVITTVSYAKLNANGTAGTWANTTSIGGSGSDTPSVVFSNGYIYVMGGVGLSTIYYAKPAPDGTISAWTTASTTMPASQQSGSGVAANNGYIYLVGGGTGTTATSFAKQNPDGSLGAFATTGATLPAARTALQSVVANGYIYAFGGWSGSTSTSTVYRAPLNNNGTITAGSWSATGLTAMPFTRHSFAIASMNGYVYLMGGISSNSNVNANPVTTNTIMFARINADGSISSWTTSTHGVGDPNGLRWVSGAAANGYLYTVGGDDGSGNTGPVQAVYYASVSRVQVAGSLDLVGINGGNLANPGTGGTLTAGDTTIVGSLNVQGQANFSQGVGISGTLGTGGDINTGGIYRVGGTAGLNLACGANIGIKSITVTGGIITAGVCTTNTLTDLAEQYNSTEALNAGEVVSVDHTNGQYVERSTSPHQDDLIGVVSTAPNYVLGGDNPGYPIALSGRVPVKVNLEGGAIQPGDKLTSSSTPGEAMKATGPGMIIGTAMTAYDGSQPSAEVTVFVSTGYYDGPQPISYIQNGGNAVLSDLTVGGMTSLADLNVSGNATINNLTVTGSATIANLTVTGSASFAGDITIGGHIITAGGQPTAQAQTPAGGSATITVDGTDTTGTITITTGSTPTAGDLAKILFSKTYGKAPHVVLSPSNDKAAGLHFYKGATSATDFMLNALDAPQANTTYVFDYMIAQ